MFYSDENQKKEHEMKSIRGAGEILPDAMRWDEERKKLNLNKSWFL